MMKIVFVFFILLVLGCVFVLPGLDRAGMESKILCTPLEAKQGCAM